MTLLQKAKAVRQVNHQINRDTRVPQDELEVLEALQEGEITLKQLAEALGAPVKETYSWVSLRIRRAYRYKQLKFITK